MPDIAVSVINASTVVSDEECRALTAALQTQVTRDFTPAWGVGATLTFVPKDQKPPAGTWWLSILDNTDRARVLGHHELTSDGLPIGKSFAGTDKHYGVEWTVTVSHELLEMLVNPDCNMTVLVHSQDGAGKLYHYEVCDPCEDDADSYAIDNIKVCNFVYPAYFHTFHQAGSTQFDYQRKLTAPVPSILPGGYISVFDLNDSNGWQQVSAALEQPGKLARVEIGGRESSRRQRRRLPRLEWRRSTAFQ
jgi:hypothetical protein